MVRASILIIKYIYALYFRVIVSYVANAIVYICFVKKLHHVGESELKKSFKNFFNLMEWRMFEKQII